jgi:hypothetical protein
VKQITKQQAIELIENSQIILCDENKVNTNLIITPKKNGTK